MTSDSVTPKLAPTPNHPIAAEPPRPGVIVRSVSRRLPAPLTSFVGRDAEVAAVCAMLIADGVRLLTLIGPGGVGKTRLALRTAEKAAAAFADGVVFVPLAAVTDPALVLPAIAREVRLRETAAQSVAELLANHLRHRHMLLVLDNVEHVVGAAPQVAALLGGCPGLAVLATSRTPLHVSSEHLFPVSPLALPVASGSASDSSFAAIATSPAVQLFVERARAAEPRFILTDENAPAIAAICHRLDGLPLAIELAAAHTRILSPAELLGRLEPALPLLTGGPSDAPARLRTVRNAIAWSYDLLTPPEQTLLQRLAVFVGGCTLEAAEDVGGLGGDDLTALGGVLASIAALVDASLVQRHDAGADTRLTMLETIREFAWEQLAASGELTEVATRHARWCVRLAETVRRSGGHSRREGLAELEAEHPNLRSALAWFLERGEATDALHLAGELAEFWLNHGHLAQGQTWLEQALAADAGEPTAARAEALAGLNMLLWFRNDLAGADRLLREAETVASAAGDAGALAFVRQHQGYVALYRGDLEMAVVRGEECLTTCSTIPQGFSCNGALWLLASATMMRGEGERATALFERLLASGRAGGDEISIGNAHYGLAHLAERRGELRRALAGFAEAAAVCRGRGDRGAASNMVYAAAATAAALGQSEEAARLLGAATALRLAAGGEPGHFFLVEHQRHEQSLKAARSALGEERFATARAAGAALSFDETVAKLQALADQVIAETPAQRDAQSVNLAPREWDSYAISVDGSAPEIAGGRHQIHGDNWQLSAPLTAREREVLLLLADGVGDKTIAATLGISRRTASQHVAAILTKLGVASRTAAVTSALHQGLLGPSVSDRV